MTNFEFQEFPKKEVVTEMEVVGSTVKYHCPDCGQRVEMGINGNENFSISYIDQEGEKKAGPTTHLEHRHIYPTYLDVEFFSRQGMEIPAIEFAEQFKAAKGQIQKKYRKQIN